MAGTPSTKTIYGGLIQTHNWLNIPYTAPAGTTLNERWNIHHNTAIGGNDRMVSEFLSIGNRGHYSTTVSGISVNKYNPHKATDAGMYNAIPFVLRPINADLGDVERQRYGMRVPVTISSVKYWAYYLMRLNLASTTPEMRITTIVDGVTTSTPFVPNQDNLTPTPPLIPNDAIQTANGQYATVNAMVQHVLSESDIEELINAVEIMYGDGDLAVITELAIVSAIRKQVARLDENRQAMSGGLQYWEALRATIVNFMGADFSAAMNTGTFGMNIDLGTSDPLFGTAQIEAE